LDHNRNRFAYRKVGSKSIPIVKMTGESPDIQKRIGCISGDMLVVINEIVEVFILLVICLLNQHFSLSIFL